MNNNREPGFLSEIAEHSPLAFATVTAGITTLFVSILAMIPGINIIIFIVVMLPLWFVHNLGVFDLGRELHGFFIPNKAGWAFIFAAVWLFWLFIGFNTQRHLQRLRQQQG